VRRVIKQSARSIATRASLWQKIVSAVGMAAKQPDDKVGKLVGEFAQGQPTGTVDKAAYDARWAIQRRRWPPGRLPAGRDAERIAHAHDAPRP
jgi:hypothetical protein